MSGWLHRSKQLCSLSRLLYHSGSAASQPHSLHAQPGFATLPNKIKKPRASKQAAAATESTSDVSSTEAVGKKAGKQVAQSRALSAFNVFQKTWYKELKDSTSEHISVSSSSKEVAAKWKALSDEQRKPYVDIAAASKEPKSKEKTKRKLSGYTLWFKENYDSVKARNPKISAKQIFTSMSKEWQAMTAEQKGVWKHMAEESSLPSDLTADT